jgi:hypothetical protein
MSAEEQSFYDSGNEELTAGSQDKEISITTNKKTSSTTNLPSIDFERSQDASP